MSKRKGFTLIELIIVMAIIGVLILLAGPKYQNYTKEARLTEIKVQVSELEKASNQYYMRYNDWPRLTDTPYTAEQLNSYSAEIYDKTGVGLVLDAEGNYYDIDYSKIKNYIAEPKDGIHYILQNPVGEIYYLHNLTDEGVGRVGQETKPEEVLEEDSKYTLATDSDFSGSTDGSFRYIGNAEYVEIPHMIKGINITSYNQMFEGTKVKGVKSTNLNITNMKRMFFENQSTVLEFTNFNTSNVTDMTYMFQNTKAKVLDLTCFDTSKVIKMEQMFHSNKATIIDLSSFDTSNVTNMFNMFRFGTATKGYAKTSTDATKLNNSPFKPSTLVFIFK